MGPTPGRRRAGSSWTHWGRPVPAPQLWRPRPCLHLHRHSFSPVVSLPPSGSPSPASISENLVMTWACQETPLLEDQLTSKPNCTWEVTPSGWQQSTPRACSAPGRWAAHQRSADTLPPRGAWAQAAAVRLAELGCGRATGRPKGLVGGAAPVCGDRCGQCQAPAVPRVATSLWGDLSVSEVAFLKTFSL